MAGEIDEKQAFYSSGNIDLKYLELGICLDVIDRMNPGTHPFAIPVLAPEKDKTKVTEDKIVNGGKGNLENENTGAVELSNIDTTNCVYIEIPRELVALPAPIYHIDGKINFICKDGEIYTKTGKTFVQGNGAITHPGGYFSSCGNGVVTGPLDTLIVRQAHMDGILTTRIHDSMRYIPKLSKWLIAFLGGDSCMPRVICHLPDANSQGQMEAENRWRDKEGHNIPPDEEQKI